MVQLPENLKDVEYEIKALSFSESSLSTFPGDSFWKHFPNLQYLDLESTNIQEIPEEINKLKNVTVLKLDHTKISSLPASFGKIFLSLKDLTISSDTTLTISLKALPGELTSATFQGVKFKLPIRKSWEQKKDSLPNNLVITD